jgi:hypothetical protein
MVEYPIDYRYADGRFTMSPRGATDINQNYLSSSETRVYAGIKKMKIAPVRITLRLEATGGICFIND